MRKRADWCEIVVQMRLLQKRVELLEIETARMRREVKTLMERVHDCKFALRVWAWLGWAAFGVLLFAHLATRW